MWARAAVGDGPPERFRIEVDTARVLGTNTQPRARLPPCCCDPAPQMIKKTEDKIERLTVRASPGFRSAALLCLFPGSSRRMGLARGQGFRSPLLAADGVFSTVGGRGRGRSCACPGAPGGLFVLERGERFVVCCVPPRRFERSLASCRPSPPAFGQSRAAYTHGQLGQWLFTEQGLCAFRYPVAVGCPRSP